MRLLKSDKLKKGMVLAEDVIRMNNNAIIIKYDKGTVLNKEKIEHIKKFFFDFVLIEDDNFKEVEYKPIISIEIREKIRTYFGDIIKLISKKKELSRDNFTIFYKLIDDLIYELNYFTGKVFPIVALSKKNDYIIEHSINTMILSLGMGKKLKFNSENLKKLAFATLFHDIGMLFVDVDINAPNRLNMVDRNEIKKHTEIGFELLSGMNFYGIGTMASYVALRHHERYDGTGYPDGLKKDEIKPIAQICGLADFYMALISDRAYRPALSRTEAIRKYILESQAFSIHMKEAFLRSVVIYPNGSEVTLNTQEKAIVIRQTEDPFMPVVKILNRYGKMGAIIDLKNDPLQLRWIIECDV